MSYLSRGTVSSYGVAIFFCDFYVGSLPSDAQSLLELFAALGNHDVKCTVTDNEIESSNSMFV
jgi:hypothetical protein